jgi:hypothetical protein
MKLWLALLLSLLASITSVGAGSGGGISGSPFHYPVPLNGFERMIIVLAVAEGGASAELTHTELVM